MPRFQSTTCNIQQKTSFQQSIMLITDRFIRQFLRPRLYSRKVLVLKRCCAFKNLSDDNYSCRLKKLLPLYSIYVQYIHIHMHTCRRNKTNALIVLAIEIIDEDVANQKMRKKSVQKRERRTSSKMLQRTNERTEQR